MSGGTPKGRGTKSERTATKESNEQVAAMFEQRRLNQWQQFKASDVANLIAWTLFGSDGRELVEGEDGNRRANLTTEETVLAHALAVDVTMRLEFLEQQQFVAMRAAAAKSAAGTSLLKPNGLVVPTL